MNLISRTISGLSIIIFSIWYIIYLGFMAMEKTDFFSIFFGVVFFVIGVFLLFNKKEDEIEKIKKNK